MTSRRTAVLRSLRSSAHLLVAATAFASLGAISLTGGCSSTSDTPVQKKPPQGGCGTDIQHPPVTGACDPDTPLTDPSDPPADCGPDPQVAACTSTSEVSTCPCDNECMAPVAQSGNVLSYRMGRIRLWAPEALKGLANIAVDPNVAPACFNQGNESFNWLLQVDRNANTLKTGGANTSTDHKTFAFLHQSVDASAIEALCPGFAGPTQPVQLDPISTPITFDGNTFQTPVFDRINIPIFVNGSAVVLPIVSAIVKNVTIGDDPTCIGAWDANYWCDGDSRGWTTAGALSGKIAVEDADHIPIKDANCESLCAVLANDATLQDKDAAGHLVCKRGSDGKVLVKGDSTITAPNDAFTLSATFAAYGVNISDTPSTGDTGTTGGDTGTPSDTGTSSDAPSGD